MHNVLRRGTLFALCLLTAWAVRAAYPKHLQVTTPDGRTVTVTALDDNILKVSNTAPGEKPRIGTASVLTQENGERLNPDGKGAVANICGMQVSLTSDGVLTIDAGNGKKVVDNGLRPVGKNGLREMDLSVDGNGTFFGTGERAHHLNLRGDTLHMYNRPNYGYGEGDPRNSLMNISMPLFVASEGYAVVFDDYAKADLILGNPVKYITESPDPVTWYFVNGARTMADVTENLSKLIGRQDLPPLWSLGYITSKYGYHTSDEAEGVIDTLKSQGYPVDGIVLDLYWYGKEQDMGRLGWDLTKWHDPDDFLGYMKQRGVNVVTIAQPYVLRNGKGIATYNELDRKGLMLKDSLNQKTQDVVIWVGEGGMFDVSNPTTQAWLKERYGSLTDRGLSGWWGDLGEPEKHPENAIHANGLTARQYHNRYGSDWAKIIYDLYREKYPDRRVMTLMRAGTTGLQRYGVFTWSSDVARTWAGLQPQIRIMLHSGLSGIGYMSSDIGGFAVDNERPTDPELYVRWLQLGTFSPTLRTHAQLLPEPYHYPEHEAVIKKLILDRYRWLPYNYTLAYENATKGYPMVRPITFHSPAGSTPAAEFDVDDEYLWGRDVLVAPVLKQGAVSRDIVIPTGSDWYDISAPTKLIAGGSTIKDYPAPLEVLPMFIREGAFIPTAEYKMQNTKGYNQSKLTVNYYPSAKAVTTYTLFEDDLVTPTPEGGNKGLLLTFTGDATQKKLTEVTIIPDGSYRGMAEAKTVTIVVHAQKDQPRSVMVDGKNARFTYDKATQTVTVSFFWRMQAPAVIRINK